MPWTEKLPNGEDAIMAALPDSWKRIFKRRGQSGVLDDGPEVDQRFVRPAWSRNDNPTELNAPQVATGSLVSGRDPGEMVVARGGGNAAPQEPIRPMPTLRQRPEFEDLVQRGPSPGAEPLPNAVLGDTVMQPLDFTPTERPRRANLPILPKTVSGMVSGDVRGGDTEGKVTVDPNEMPVILPRNFSSSMFAPTKTQNPDYIGHQPPIDESARRPKVNDELGYAETHTPMPRHGRFVEALKGAGLGFLRGVGTTGTLGGGIGGAATLGTMSAIDPKYAESAQNQMFTIPHLQQQEAIRVGRNEQALKQAGQAADIGYKRAQTDEATARASSLRNPKITPHYETRAKGTYVVDSQNPEGRLLRGVPGKPSTTQPKTEWIGGVLNAYDENGVPAPVMRDGKPVTSREKTPIKVKMSDGSDVWVTPAEALSADAVRGRTEREGYSQDVTAQNEQGERERAAKIAQDNADYQTEVSNRRDAQAALTEYNRTYRALQQNLSASKQHDRDRAALDARRASMSDADYQKASDALEARKIQIEEENARLKDEADAAGAELTNTGIHAKYVKQLPSGYFELGPEIPRPTVPPAAPVRSRRMPLAQSTAPPISEDAFVEAARQKMGRAFDEGKARAAWQKKYGGH